MDLKSARWERLPSESLKCAIAGSEIGKLIDLEPGVYVDEPRNRV